MKAALRKAGIASRDTFTDRTFVRRYALMGVFSVVVNLGSFWVFHHVFHTWYLLAAFMAFSVRSVFKFLVIRLWVFTDRATERLIPQLSRFMLVDCTLFAVGVPMLYILVERLWVPPLAALMIVISILYGVGLVTVRTWFRPRNLSL